MTTAIALTGQWDGLRAFPRALRTDDHRRRLENGLERLSGLYEAMSIRAALLAAGMERLNGLRAGMIDQLDAIDAPEIDLEPTGDDEPSLCGVRCGGPFMASDDLEDSADDNGEPSLGWGWTINQERLHSADGDLEDDHDGREPDSDDEAEPDSEADDTGACAWADAGDQTTLERLPVYVRHRRPPPMKHPVVYLIGPGVPHLHPVSL